MTDHDPQNENEEMDFDSTDPLPEDNDDIEESEHATADIPPADLIDLIADQRASEARDEIFKSLYAKAGERIDGIKAEIRKVTEE